MSRRVAADRVTRQNKSAQTIRDVVLQSNEDRLGYEVIRKASRLSPKTVEKALQQLVDEGIIGKIPSKSTKNVKAYFSIGKIEKKQKELEHLFEEKVKDAFSCVSPSDYAIVEVARQHVENLKNHIRTSIEDSQGLDIYSRLKGEYFSAIYSGIDEIEDAIDRAKQDHLDAEGQPKCTNCKHAKWRHFRGERVCQCTLTWNARSRDYNDPDYSCSKFEWK